MTSSLRRALASAACASLLLPTAACSLLDRGAGKEKGPTFPEAWDSRVLPYAELASELRGLEFEHPVTVEFQSPAEFEKGLAADESELDEEDREELENFAGMLRAMGLVHGEVDLFDEQDKLMTGGALAYYSYEDKLVRVRGTKITPAVKSTLVHELVHVLQDQVFDSGKRQKELAEADDSSGLVYDALVEGDARRIETKYAEQLKPAQRRALHRDEERQRRGATSAIKDVPEVLQTMMGARRVSMRSGPRRGGARRRRRRAARRASPRARRRARRARSRSRAGCRAARCAPRGRGRPRARSPH